MYVGWRSPAVFAYHGHPPCLDPSSMVGWTLHTHSYWLRGTGLSPFPQKQLPKQMWREEMETFLSLVLSCSLSCACLCTYCSTRLEGSPVGVGQGETLASSYIFLSISLSLYIYSSLLWYTLSFCICSLFVCQRAAALCPNSIASVYASVLLSLPLPLLPCILFWSTFFSLLYSDVVGSVGSLSTREQRLI